MICSIKPVITQQKPDTIEVALHSKVCMKFSTFVVFKLYV